MRNRQANFHLKSCHSDNPRHVILENSGARWKYDGDGSHAEMPQELDNLVSLLAFDQVKRADLRNPKDSTTKHDSSHCEGVSHRESRQKNGEQKVTYSNEQRGLPTVRTVLWNDYRKNYTICTFSSGRSSQ